MKILVTESQYNKIKKKRSNNEIGIELLKEAPDSYDRDLIIALVLLRSASQYRYHCNFSDANHELSELKSFLLNLMKLEKLI